MRALLRVRETTLGSPSSRVAAQPRIEERPDFCFTLNGFHSSAAVVDRNLCQRPPQNSSPRLPGGLHPASPASATGFTHFRPVARRCITPTVAPASEPGPSLGSRGSPGSGVRGRPRQSDQLSTGCGGGAERRLRLVRRVPRGSSGAERRHRSVRRVPRGIGSQGWVPAFAGTTKRGQRPAQPGCRAHPMHALA